MILREGRALESFLLGTDIDQVPFVAWPEGSRGNGAAVRVVPVACLYHHDLRSLMTAARASARTTHAHPCAQAACILQALALARVFAMDCQKDLHGRAFLLDLASQIADASPHLPAKLDTAADMLRSVPSPRKAAELLGNGVVADESVPLALYLFALRGSNLHDLLMATVEHGGDTDTIAAMSCSLAGAALGMEGIPSSWLSRLDNRPRGRDHIVRLAEELFQLWQAMRKCD